jgi:hypothetical protein
MKNINDIMTAHRRIILILFRILSHEDAYAAKRQITAKIKIIDISRKTMENL